MKTAASMAHDDDLGDVWFFCNLKGIDGAGQSRAAHPFGTPRRAGSQPSFNRAGWSAGVVRAEGPVSARRDRFRAPAAAALSRR